MKIKTTLFVVSLLVLSSFAVFSVAAEESMSVSESEGRNAEAVPTAGVTGSAMQSFTLVDHTGQVYIYMNVSEGGELEAELFYWVDEVWTDSHMDITGSADSAPGGLLTFSGFVGPEQNSDSFFWGGLDVFAGTWSTFNNHGGSMIGSYTLGTNYPWLA